MIALLGEPWAGLLALAVLLLWPGLLIVRAPWPFVPFLSLSFWLLSWDWLPAAGPGRHRFLIVSLAFSTLFSGLRLLKPLAAGRPSRATLAVLALALSRVLPYSAWPVAPGLDPGFASASALLLVWRDGVPGSYLPLYPILGFGLGGAGLAALAADISLLAAVPPYRAFLLATLASEGLFILAVFALARRFWPESWALSSACTVAALALLAGVGRGGGGGEVLAMALAVAAASLVLHTRDRSPRVAAGVLGAGCAAVSALTGAVGVLATMAAIAATRGLRSLGGLGLPATLCALLATPLLWRITVAGRLLPPSPLAAAFVFMVVFGVAVAARGGGAWPPPPAWVIAGTAAIAMVATAADWHTRSAQVLVTADDVAAAAWLQAHSRSTDVVCAQSEVARAWIPALAGRAASPPRWPSVFMASHIAGALPACTFVWAAAGSPHEAANQVGRVSLRRVAPLGP
jgi:hypothetical protein